MLKRKFLDTLLEWKQTKRNECLLVSGARQVGKTFIIEHFGRTFYSSYVYLNFLENPDYRTIFEGSLEPREVYRRMSLLVPNATFIEGDTLVFLDEIQVCKKARTALKFLALDARYDVVASGSLLGIHYDEDDTPDDEASIPVGYERELKMNALDLEEFLWASGVSSAAIDELRTCFAHRRPLEHAVVKKYSDLVRTYLVIGGMPSVVNAFLAADNFAEAFSAQEKVLRAYEDDIGKYAPNVEKPKIRNVYRSIPRQLSKEYTKFQYSKVDRGGSARKYGNAIDWLVDAGLVGLVDNVSLPTLPLKSYESPDEFKVYLSDVGLLTCMLGRESQLALARGALTGPAKGGVYENLVYDMLSKRGMDLHYFKRENSAQEIEFLIERNGEVQPVEVKSKKGATPSLDAFIEEFRPRTAYKLIDGNVGQDGPRVTLPHVMAMFI